MLYEVITRLLAAAGDGQHPRQAAAPGAGDAGAQPVGPGGHLRGAGGVRGDRAQGVITSYSIHYTKLYDAQVHREGKERAWHDQAGRQHLNCQRSIV